jgi:hypothetical protein
LPPPRFRFCGFLVAVLGRRARFERAQQAARNCGNLIHAGQERRFVGLRGLVEAGDFPYKLKGSCVDLVCVNRRIEIEQSFDIPAHSLSLQFRRFQRSKRFGLRDVASVCDRKGRQPPAGVGNERGKDASNQRKHGHRDLSGHGR